MAEHGGSNIQTGKVPHMVAGRTPSKWARSRSSIALKGLPVGAFTSQAQVPKGSATFKTASQARNQVLKLKPVGQILESTRNKVAVKLLTRLLLPSESLEAGGSASKEGGVRRPQFLAAWASTLSSQNKRLKGKKTTGRACRRRALLR